MKYPNNCYFCILFSYYMYWMLRKKINFKLLFWNWQITFIFPFLDEVVAVLINVINVMHSPLCKLVWIKFVGRKVCNMGRSLILLFSVINGTFKSRRCDLFFLLIKNLDLKSMTNLHLNRFWIIFFGKQFGLLFNKY